TRVDATRAARPRAGPVFGAGRRSPSRGGAVGLFRRFERGLEGMITGSFAKLFRSAVQPVEIASALQRELDNSAQILSRDASLVPNDFIVELSPSDHQRLAPYAQTLTRELAEVVSRHAGTQNYSFTGPVTVSFT